VWKAAATHHALQSESAHWPSLSLGVIVSGHSALAYTNDGFCEYDAARHIDTRPRAAFHDSGVAWVTTCSVLPTSVDALLDRDHTRALCKHRVDDSAHKLDVAFVRVVLRETPVPQKFIRTPPRSQLTASPPHRT
jgi:hypothetical protein